MMMSAVHLWKPPQLPCCQPIVPKLCCAFFVRHCRTDFPDGSCSPSSRDLFRVNQRGRKYPVHAGKGLFTFGCAQCYGQIRPACIRIYEILGTRLTSNSLRGFVLDTQMLLRPVLSSFVAFTAMSAFIGLPRRVLSFALQATWSGAQKSKCPSWRGKATVRPRCQGRRVVAFIGAKRRPFTAGGIRRRVWPGRADLPLTESLARKV